MRTDLALIGFGNVGRRFARLIEERRERLLGDDDLDCRIVGISTRRHGSAFDSHGLDAVQAAVIVERGESLSELGALAARPHARSFDIIGMLAVTNAPLHVMVEVTPLDISAGQPAIEHVRAALACGCHVTTANKGPAAFEYRDLRAAADAAGRSFLFEGAVMDGIPLFNLVRETLPAVKMLGFRGVVNSTTNYILSALEEGEDFEPALARMQAEGIAEADASLDLDGWDAAAKAAALANVLLDARITPHDIRRSGIGPGTAAAALAATGRGNRLRLVATARRGATPVVEPVELPPGDLLARVRGTANVLILQTDLLGEIAIAQLGGSLTETAYALVTDLVTIRRRQQALHEGLARRTL
jgi:homoserine dehydrogenase